MKQMEKAKALQTIIDEAEDKIENLIIENIRNAEYTTKADEDRIRRDVYAQKYIKVIKTASNKS